MTKIRCGIRENTKCLDGQQDLTATREAGFIKIWARDARFPFACLSGIRNRQARVQCGVPRVGGEVLPYMGYIGMCDREGYGFQAVYPGIGYITLAEDFRLDEGTWELPLKNIKNQIGFVLAGLC